MRFVGIVTIGFLVACGGSASDNTDAGKSVDAPTIDAPDIDAQVPPGHIPCLGAARPTQAMPMVTITGKTRRVTINGLSDFPGQVALRDDSSNLITQTQADAMGDFSVTVATQGTPLAGYLVADDPNATGTPWSTYIEPPYDVTEDLTGAAAIVSTAEVWNLFSRIVTGIDHVNGNGIVAVAVTDCDEKAMEKITITTSRNSDVYYPDIMNITDPSVWPSTTGDGGLAIIFNVPAGTLEITATTEDGYVLRKNEINVRPDALTSTIVVP